jgi:hypothetical protein
MHHLTFSLPEGIRQTSTWKPNQFLGICRRPNSFDILAIGIDGKIDTLQTLVHRFDFAVRSKVHESVSHKQQSPLSIWLFGQQSLIAIGPSGKLVQSLSLSDFPEFDPLPDEEIGAALATDEAVYLSVNRGVNNTSKQSPEHDLTARLVKVSLTGELIWSTKLPAGKIEYGGVSYMSADTGWKTKSCPPWFPTTWKSFGHDLLLESGNRIMVGLAESSSGVGCRYAVDSDSGEIVWQSEYSAGGNSVSIGDGSFLICDQGYDEFRTRLFRNDKVEMSWPSHGHSFSNSGRFFSIQLANVSSQPQHCVEMKMDSSVAVKSEPLGGYYTTRPQQLSDRAVYFWRNDAIWRWLPGEGVKVVLKTDFGNKAFGTGLQITASRIGFHIRHDGHSTMVIFNLIE